MQPGGGDSLARLLFASDISIDVHVTICPHTLSTVLHEDDRGAGKQGPDCDYRLYIFDYDSRY